MRKSVVAASAALIAMLAACTTQASLDEQLQGKSQAEREAILTEQCHREAGKGFGSRKNSWYGPHVQRMHHICDRMAQEFSPTSKN